MPHVLVQRKRQWLKVVLAIIVAHWLSGPVILAIADEPQPDPAGIATGDKTTTYDAGGNAFVVTEPTDKTAPDYATGRWCASTTSAGPPSSGSKRVSRRSR
jgi:hypothetical protein